MFLKKLSHFIVTLLFTARNPCDRNPCANGALCRVQQGSCNAYTCECQGCYTGFNCELRKRFIKLMQNIGLNFQLDVSYPYIFLRVLVSSVSVSEVLMGCNLINYKFKIKFINTQTNNINLHFSNWKSPQIRLYGKNL